MTSIRRHRNTSSFRSITKAEPLSKEIQVDLVRKAQDGDIEATNLLIETNMRLVVKFAVYYARRANIYTYEVAPDDLLCAGVIGIREAIKTYDSAKETCFITWARWYLRREMTIAVKQNRLIHVADVKNKKTKQTQKTDARPTETRRAFYCSLDDPDSYLDDLPLIDAPDKETQTVKDAAKALSCLSEDEHDIVNRVYGLDGREPEAINGLAQPKSRSAGRRLYLKALRKMQSHMGLLPRTSFFKDKQKDSLCQQEQKNAERSRNSNKKVQSHD